MLMLPPLLAMRSWCIYVPPSSITNWHAKHMHPTGKDAAMQELSYTPSSHHSETCTCNGTQGRPESAQLVTACSGHRPAPTALRLPPSIPNPTPPRNIYITFPHYIHNLFITLPFTFTFLCYINPFSLYITLLIIIILFSFIYPSFIYPSFSHSPLFYIPLFSISSFFISSPFYIPFSLYISFFLFPFPLYPLF